jgi:hypothetical protein
MKELYCQIGDWMASQTDGWSSKEKVAALVGAILAMRPAVVLEIGIWSGKSFIPMAMAMQHIKSTGVVIGIDPWSADASAQGMDGEHLKWWANVDHNRIFKLFNEEMLKFDLHPFCKIFRCRSDEWKIPDDLVIDLLHIDGNHGEQASVFDVDVFASRVRIGGLVWMDDSAWAAKAVGKMYYWGFQRLFELDRGIMFQRISKPNL